MTKVIKPLQNKIPRVTYPSSLPITAKRNEIVQAIRSHQCIIVTGETGSGKTTQIPKMCLEAQRGIAGIIGCTQPRRVAAVTVARRIAEELGEEVGRSVGYKIRFEDKSGNAPFVKIMTDGILLMEAQADPMLRAYDTIIVDEAHERNLNIDFVLGILRKLLPRRRDLKVIITSATIDAEKFSLAFGNAPIISVSGRMYPVEVRYRPPEAGPEEGGENSHVDWAVTAFNELAERGVSGNILIFMPTEQDIRETCEMLEGRHGDAFAIMPMFARLPWLEQQRVFQPTPRSKIIVATNIAETSITIPGIHYVIDTGLARISQYNPRSRTNSLPVRAISKSSADQRKGRCGRVRNGICIRLYERDDYESRSLFTPPEILRANLADVILRMLALHLGEVPSFPFIDPPNPKSIRDGIDILQEIGAVEQRKGTLALTPIGRRMARLPIDPRIARMIIEAEKSGCLDEVTVIAAALSAADPRERPADLEAEADKIQAVFTDPASDFMTILAIWRRYHAKDIQESRGKMRRFCRDHFLSYRRMREWQDVYHQLTEILDEQGKKRLPERGETDAQTLYAGIHRSILSGFLSHIARKKEKNLYTATHGRQVMIFPGSGIFGRGGNWIVAAEMVETSRLFARTAANIDGAWLEEIGGTLCRSTYSEPRWMRNRGEVVAFEQVSLFGLVIVPQRTVSYGRIDPEEASRIFLQSALVEGDVAKPFPFLVHNEKLKESIETMEDKVRRHGLLANDDAAFRFYEERLAGIYDVRSLQKLIREKGSDGFLRMREEDILLAEPDPEELALYPDEIVAGRCRLRCTYRFAPGASEDGVTVKIPLDLVGSVPAAPLEWAVPGLYREKIGALLKGLPKEYRKKLMPLAGTVEIILQEMDCRDGYVLSALGKFIFERFDIDIPVHLWPADSLPEHLKVRFAIVGEDDRELASGRDFSALQKGMTEEAESAAFAQAKQIWEREGVTEWNFGDLPAYVTLERSGAFQGFTYPALTSVDTGVDLRLFTDEREASLTHRKGVARLYAIRFREELRYLKKAITPAGVMKEWAVPFGGVAVFTASIIDRVKQDLFEINVRTSTAFEAHADKVKGEILLRGQNVLQTTSPVFKAYHDTASNLSAFAKTHRGNRPVLRYLEDLRGEMDRLVPRNFSIRYGEDRFPHIVRYLRALVIRAERGVIHLEKAWMKSDEIKIFVNRLADMTKNLPPFASEEKRKAIEEFAWMIEEYKVSLFAQELKTAFPVSRKRLEEKIREIVRIT